MTLGGQGLMVDLQSYRRRVAPAFVSRQASGDRQYDDGAFYQHLLLDSWAGGELLNGQREHDPDHADRYRAGVGADGYSVAGALQNGPSLQSSYASAIAGFYALQAYNGKLYAGGADGKVYEHAAGVWSMVHDTTRAGGVRSLAVWNGKLYAGNGTDGVVASYDGTTWTAAAFTVASAAGIYALASHGESSPLLWLGSAASAATGQGRLHSWNGGVITNAFTAQEQYVFALALLDEELYFSGVDDTNQVSSLYRQNGGLERLVARIPDNTITGLLGWNGALYLTLGVGGELWRYDTTNGLQFIARDLADSGTLRGLAVWNGALWIGGLAGTEARLWRYDGEALSQAIAGGDLSGGQVQALGLLSDELYVATTRFSNASIYKAAEGTPRTSTTVESGLFDAELPSVDKVFRDVVLVYDALPASCSIEVQYQLEGSGAWTSLGTADLDGSTSATLSFGANVTGKLIGLRIVLTGTSGTSPLLYSLALRYALQPTVKREWEFAVLAEGTAELPLITEDQEASPDTGEAIADALWTLKAAAGTKTFVDLDGSNYTVWMVDLQDELADRSQRQGLHYRAKVRLLEA